MVVCEAESVPKADGSVFDISTIKSATLKVPAAALSDYKSESPWCYFGTLVAIQSSEIKISSITLSRTSLNITEGSTWQLSASVSPNDATNKTVTWTSSNTSVATVSSDGLVTAKSAGSATITCTAADGSGVKAYCSVTVIRSTVSVTRITLSSTSKSLCEGDTYQLSAAVSPSNATNKNVTWTSSNTSVATVSSDGLVTAMSAGSATITCTAADGSGVKATCSVTVTKQQIAATLGVKIHLASGKTVVYSFNDSPVLSFSNDMINWKTNTTSASYNFSDFDYYEFVDVVDGINNVQADYKFSANNNIVSINGIGDNDRIHVYNVNGGIFDNCISTNASEATIDLQSQPNGVYIIKLNNTNTYKIIK